MNMRKLNNKFLGIASVAFAAVGLVSCQNEFDNPDFGFNTAPGAASLVKSPDVIAWSGKQALGSTFTNVSTRGSQEAPFWNGTAQVKPVDVTDEEKAFVE